MARIHKLVLAIAATSAFTSGVAHALGLGEVTLQSALNQPLVAEIELLEVRDLATDELLSRLASPEEFSKAGVDHSFFLSDLTFTPVIRPDGKSVIRVSSSKPVREPYLNFLVEVLWPNGRLLREYTVLLDPPLYSPQSAAAIAPQLPVAAPVSAQVQRSATQAPRATISAQAASDSGSKQYRTVKNDTLWEIAQSLGSGGSVQQTMLAIQDLNPNAFVDQNINRLKTGQVLRLPEEQEIKLRTRGEAIARVAEQNAAWQAWRQARSQAAGVRQLDATKRSAAEPAPEKVEIGDSLRLVSGEQGQATAGQDGGVSEDSQAVLDKLALAKENLDTSRREGAELQSRMGDLESQLDKLQRLIQLKDSQLATLQADLAREVEQADPLAPTTLNEPVPAVEVEPVAPLASQPAATAPNTDSGVLAAVPTEPVAAAGDEAPLEQPVVTSVSSFMDRLLADPLLLGAVGGGSLLVLLLALMALSRRNAMKEAELREGMAISDHDQGLDRELALPNNSFDDLDLIADGQEGAADEGAELLGEANIYIAYGRFNQAAELLLNALDDEPQRRDLRLKLMEVFAEQGDRSGFAQQEAELREIGGANADIQQLKDKYPDMAHGGSIQAAVGAGAIGAGAFASQLDFAGDDIDLDSPSRGKSQVDAGMSGLGNMGYGDSLQPSPGSEAETASNDLSLPRFNELDFDLQLDDETTQALAEDIQIAEPTLQDLGLPAGVDEFIQPQADYLSEPSFDLATGISADESLLGDLPDDFDLSLHDDELSNDEESEADADDFEAELERVNAQLDTLTDDLNIPVSAEPVFDIADLGPLEEDEFDFLSGTNETATKLDLARAYIDMGDSEGARDILDEVLGEGDETQQGEARELIAKLS